MDKLKEPYLEENSGQQIWHPTPQELVNKINELIDQQNRIEEAIKYLANKMPVDRSESLWVHVDEINKIFNP